MRTSRTIKRSLALKIRGIDTEERLDEVFKIVEFVPLDNGAKLCTKPAGATYHFCIEGRVEDVDDVIKRLNSGQFVETELSEELLRILSDDVS